MTLTFRKKTEARNYLMANGYRFCGYGKLDPDTELYSTGPLGATLSKAAWRGYRVRIL